MSESATDAKLRNLAERLEREQTAHTRTRNELQATVERVWRLVPSHWINLMGVYPSLRRLVHVLAEAADLQDPSRGVTYENTMRTEYTPDGETLTPTERGVFSHRKARSNVNQLDKEIRQLQIHIHREIEYRTHRMGQMIPGSHWEYNPPEGDCVLCGGLVVQPVTGRRRKYCQLCSPQKERVG